MTPIITPFKQIMVFALTFLCYVGLHSMRAAWAYSKSLLSEQYHYPQWINGAVDTTYLICYSFGMGTIGTMTNKFRLNLFLGIGMVLAAMSFSSFAAVALMAGKFSVPLMFVGMALNGFFQSSGWPGMMATMGNWFGKGRRGLLLAFWSVNANIGNILGSVICSNLQESWKMNVLVTAAISASIGLVITLLLQPAPKGGQDYVNARQSQISQPEQQEGHLTKSEIHPQTGPNAQRQFAIKQPTRQINVCTALFLPRVGFYVVGYAMLKGCVYGLLFWLPSYLQQKHVDSEKGYISAMVDVGALMGGMIVGHLGDQFKLRALFLSPLLFLGSIVMLVVSHSLSTDPLPYYFLMFLIGIFTGGPYNVIGSAIAVDLGQQPMLKQTKNAVSTISALVEGSAAIFSVISQILIPLISLDFMFVMFCCESIIATIALFPLFLQDLRIYRSRAAIAKKNID